MVMFPLLYMYFVSYVVKCDGISDYNVEGTYSETSRDKPFLVYWNMPTIQCQKKKIPFDNLYETYGIIQNNDDSFRGDKISILYKPGNFPELTKGTNGEVIYTNGGVPQEGDLDAHLRAFKSELIRSIPEKNFNGLGIIDFESWRPVFRQNNGVMVPYKEISVEIERSRHTWWPEDRLLKEAIKRFEAAARDFMKSTLAMAKKLRPQATWGYYGFPYCFNMVPSHMEESCANGVEAENDNLEWLWSESDALYPSVYTKRIRPAKIAELIRGRIHEANRVKAPDSKVFAYFWPVYVDDGRLMSEKDVVLSLKTIRDADVDGVIIWASSADVNTVDKCLKLQKYLDDVLGPTVAQYTNANRVEDANGDPYGSSL